MELPHEETATMNARFTNDADPSQGAARVVLHLS